MSDVILHHYAESPYAEKIRLILGAKNIAWKSVIIPRMMPKPDLIALTGGYRRTPVMQIGADIYCDTALIAEKLDKISPEPPLLPRDSPMAAKVFSHWADSTFFQTLVTLYFRPDSFDKIFPDDPKLAKAIAIDRATMSRNPSTPMSQDQATAAFKNYLHGINAQLKDGRKFLFGNQPTIADYSLYHPLWFRQKLSPDTSELDTFNNVKSWLVNMIAIGHAEYKEISSTMAIEKALEASVETFKTGSDLADLQPGDSVEVLPTDYALDPVTGKLLVCNRSEIIVQRQDALAGTLNVHFPRLNYETRRAE